MRSFAPEIDLPTVNEWLEKRKFKPLQIQDIPRIGSIVDGVACGFLVATDCSTCFLDCFVTNPDAPGAIRSEAIGGISKWLLTLAEAHGFKRVIVLTQTESIKERAEALGFKMNGSAVLALDLA